MKTEIEDVQNLSFSVDWRSNGKPVGHIIALTDYNPGKVLLRLGYSNGKITASSYVSKKFKRRKIFVPEWGMWYRFNVTTKGKNYAVTITERGADNRTNGNVVFNSTADKKRLRLNTKVVPSLLTLNTWGKDPDFYYDYDNLIVQSN